MNYKNIFLVDDDLDDQEFFTTELSTVTTEINCTVAGDGYEALELLEKHFPHIPDLIFLDLNMPKMGGLEFIGNLKNVVRYAAFKHIPIVILTTNVGDLQECLDTGACLCLNKPSEVKAYRTMLKAILASNLKDHSDELRLFFAK